MIKVYAENEGRKEYYCSVCNEVLEPERRGKSYCKTCKKEYNAEYYQANKEYYQKLTKQYRDEHKDYYSDYNRMYQAENEDYFKEKRKQNYIKDTDKHYLYSIESETESLYVGATNNKKRPFTHLKGKTHLKINPQKWVEKGVKRIRYIDITEFLNDEHSDILYSERDYLERLFIIDNQNENMLNDKLSNPCLRVDRMEELEHIFKNYLVDFDELEILQIVKDDLTVEFNYNDLRLL